METRSRIYGRNMALPHAYLLQIVMGTHTSLLSEANLYQPFGGFVGLNMIGLWMASVWEYVGDFRFGAACKRISIAMVRFLLKDQLSYRQPKVIMFLEELIQTVVELEEYRSLTRR
ncbi:hypothetical protein MKW98_011331 [Papaver atlanticum]|uniref:Uncharacterized protein n=1 Tax=Papaver atlanticum TaxID=357466 RepID=A0AAD4SV41_9MAGN|nr:hypothetical protein MKW98_011331 [Papaver atlanticum]